MAKNEPLGYVYITTRRSGNNALWLSFMQEKLSLGETIFIPTLSGASLSRYRNIGDQLKCRVKVVYDDHSGDRLILDYNRWGEPIGINWEKSRPAPSISGLRLLSFDLAEELKDNEYYLGIKVI